MCVCVCAYVGFFVVVYFAVFLFVCLDFVVCFCGFLLLLVFFKSSLANL